MLLVGEFRANMDSQSRVTVPAPLAKGLGQSFVVTGLESWNHVVLFPKRLWQNLVTKAEKTAILLDPEFVHFLPLLGANSCLVKTDAKRRFTIPSNLRPFAGPELVFVGAVSSVRLYSADVWNEEKRESSAHLEALAERLGGRHVEKN